MALAPVVLSECDDGSGNAFHGRPQVLRPKIHPMDPLALPCFAGQQPLDPAFDANGLEGLRTNEYNLKGYHINPVARL